MGKGDSAFKKAYKGRTHRERSQPKDRQKLGILEKHKDYVLRAQDFHKKERRLKSLREKARNRNKDEFYFNMINSRVNSQGAHVKKNASHKYTHDEILLLKSQDLSYVATMKQREKRKAEKLQANLSIHSSILNDDVKGTHTVFVDGEKEVAEFQPEEFFETPRELLTGDTFIRLRKSQLKDANTICGISGDIHKIITRKRKRTEEKLDDIEIDDVDPDKEEEEQVTNGAFENESSDEDDSREINDDDEEEEEDISIVPVRVDYKKIRPMKKLIKNREAAAKNYIASKKRLESLDKVEKKLELKKNLMGKSGSVRKIKKKEGGSFYVWKKERKR